MEKRSRSKWRKHNVMAADSVLRDALPETRRMSRSNLYALLDRYSSVIVKPTGKWGGEGVLKASRLMAGGYKLHAERDVKRYADRDSLYTAVKRRMKNKCIVQRRIPLAAVNDRPFDLRVMVQRRPGERSWHVTGCIAKVAGRGYIVTNVLRSGGKVVRLADAIRQSDMYIRDIDAITERIDRIALRAARRLHGYYRDIRTIGLDLGLDKHGHVWIIEPNFKPNIGLFRRYRTMYKRILSYRPNRS